MTVERMAKFYFDSFDPLRSKENAPKPTWKSWVRLVAVIFGTVVGTAVTVGILPICLYCFRPRTKENRTENEARVEKVFQSTTTTTPKMSVKSEEDQRQKEVEAKQKEAEAKQKEVEAKQKEAERETEVQQQKEVEAKQKEEEILQQKAAEQIKKTVTEAFKEKAVWVNNASSWPPREGFTIQLIGNLYHVYIKTLDQPAVHFQLQPENVVEKLQILLDLANSNDFDVRGQTSAMDETSTKIHVRTWKSEGEFPFLISGDPTAGEQWLDYNKASVTELREAIEAAKKQNKDLKSKINLKKVEEEDALAKKISDAFKGRVTWGITNTPIREKGHFQIAFNSELNMYRVRIETMYGPFEVPLLPHRIVKKLKVIEKFAVDPQIVLVNTRPQPPFRYTSGPHVVIQLFQDSYDNYLFKIMGNNLKTKEIDFNKQSSVTLRKEVEKALALVKSGVGTTT